MEQPDIAAPGIDILASYTPIKSLTGLKGDTMHSKFTLMSGTSMACPHVAGVAAYVKSFRPNWSPAAIKSAIMITGKNNQPSLLELTLSRKLKYATCNLLHFFGIPFYTFNVFFLIVAKPFLKF